MHKLAALLTLIAAGLIATPGSALAQMLRQLLFPAPQPLPCLILTMESLPLAA
jgi:hypothetical protein